MHQSLKPGGAKCAGSLLIAIILSGSLVGCAATRAGNASRPHMSTFRLYNFALRPAGLLFDVHPTTRPIRVEAVADAPLKVCQFGTSFAEYWHGGCRVLRNQSIELPTTSGQMHVAFRVASVSGKLTWVKEFELQWHCTDHDFGVFRGRTPVSSGYRTFDC